MGVDEDGVEVQYQRLGRRRWIGRWIDIRWRVIRNPKQQMSH